MQLNSEQIQKIRQLVELQDIHVSHLSDDLVDHLCCMAEDQLGKGGLFELVLHELDRETKENRLQKIQNETLFLIDKNYRIMKTAMKYVGVVSMAFVSLGALCKIEHFPGANYLFTVGFVLLGLIFFPASIYVLRKESKQKERVWLYASALLGGIALIMGIMFKVMHWPYSTLIMFSGYLVIIVLFLPFLLQSLLKDENSKSMRNVYILGVGALFLTITGGVLKLMHWPGAFPFLWLGSLALSAFFLPAYAHLKYGKESHVKMSFILLSTALIFFSLFNLLLSYRH